MGDETEQEESVESEDELSEDGSYDSDEDSHDEISEEQLLKAVEVYKDKQAMFVLGHQYDLKNDKENAAKWYLEASNHGSRIALKALINLYISQEKWTDALQYVHIAYKKNISGIEEMLLHVCKISNDFRSTQDFLISEINNNNTKAIGSLMELINCMAS